MTLSLTEAQALVRQLVASTSEAYGDMGLFDPAELARIDFLHQVRGRLGLGSLTLTLTLTLALTLTLTLAR